MEPEGSLPFSQVPATCPRIYIYIYIYIIGHSPARDTPHTDQFDSLEPEPSRTR
jgi:hypothetical protein